MKLFFRFGTHPNLSYAEIMAFLKSNKIGYLEEYSDLNVLIIETQIDTDYADLINQLGGTVKIGEIIGELTELKDTEAVGQVILDEIVKFEGKKYFGLSLINREFAPFKSKKQLEVFGLTIKNELEGPARFVTSKEPELSSVIVQKEKLLTNGGDFNLIYTSDKVYVGLTKAVQDFKAYSYRDFGRPVFDSKSGMLPPKVAQIMINLAGADKEVAVYDPFCGSGTILQELLLKDYTNIIGSDLSAKAVADSKINLEWLANKDGLEIERVKVFQADATKMSSSADPSAKGLWMTTSVGAIITEPFLGPALKGRETKEEGIKVRKELEQLYIDAFKEFKKVLVPGGVVVIIVPAFKVKEGIVNMNIIDSIQRLGFQLKKDYKNIEGLKFRYPLMYYREDQRVLREVMVFKLGE